jgi:DNA-binding transcriptional regulator YdaS (Cro superfamily)
MDLRTYLKTTTQAAFAEQLHVTQGTIAHWLAGRVVIPLERCPAIEQATEGAVTRHDLRPDFFGPAPGVEPPDQTPAADGRAAESAPAPEGVEDRAA